MRKMRRKREIRQSGIKPAVVPVTVLKDLALIPEARSFLLKSTRKQKMAGV
jgi:hypothetical protein